MGTNSQFIINHFYHTADGSYFKAMHFHAATLLVFPEPDIFHQLLALQPAKVCHFPSAAEVLQNISLFSSHIAAAFKKAHIKRLSILIRQYSAQILLSLFCKGS